ncbi:hypothetical protein KP509_14G070000 [Ceratopteris richardii]|uniref:Uncharacterized protein n=1 Tax=Ceratopteris richardii TaxID=49495 RepID=A0A8T2TG38_CERRI|nr:hypothetical protein KP509_14G070000 [Ceratopteris richardii]
MDFRAIQLKTPCGMYVKCVNEFMQVDGGIALYQQSILTPYSNVLTFVLEIRKPITTPMESNFGLSSHAKDVFDIVLYQQIVQCFIHVFITWLDIQFSISPMSKFMHSPSVKNWHIIKHIFCSLHSTHSLGCFISRGDKYHQIHMLSKD